mmetsp:Transcript_92493/g.261606  ORF Transcript_92493/g.261606 Transcript_92493/m.261606 type:complete len:477 (+) Transcript_92493:117-1547(+)
MFSCCCNPLDPGESLEFPTKRKIHHAKIRPLLTDLEAQFQENCGEDGMLDRAELGEIWKKVACSKVGKLSKEEEELIDHSCDTFFSQMDMSNDGYVSYEEFATFMLGTDESRGGLDMRTWRKDVNTSLKKNPKKLDDMIRQFKTWDKNGDGKITKEELEEVLKDMHNSADCSDNDIYRLESIRDNIFDAADLEGDGMVDLWEVMSYMLGRKKTPVEVLLYDVSKGFAQKWSKVLMGKTVQACHTGVLVYNSEYWCGGSIFRSEPPCTKAFGEPLAHYSKSEPLEASEVRPELPVIKMGYTFVTHDEFVSWLAEKMVPLYDRARYDILTHSCNHFTNEVVTFLTGQPLPKRIFDLQKAFLTPTLIAMRPFLNKFMCCFGDAQKRIDASTGFAEDYMPENRHDNHDALISEVLGTGETVVLTGLDGLEKHDHVLGKINDASKDGHKFDVTYFDPIQEKLVKAKGVDALKVRRLSGDPQ